jgi:mono/diheme cytochrome c family protein
MRTFILIFAALVLIVIAMAGFRGQKSPLAPIEIFPDMDRQPKVKAQVASDFFADGRAARDPVPGTVPIGFTAPTTDGPGPYEDIVFTSGQDYFETGRMGENWGTGFPFQATMATMERGRERFGIYCAVCHGTTGAGDGMAQKFGLNTVQSLLQDRIRTMADGEIFNTITHGKNTMLGYGDRIQVPDRWAIIAYLRALQKSQGGATVQDVPEAEMANLEKQ